MCKTLFSLQGTAVLAVLTPSEDLEMKQNSSCESVWQSKAEWNFLPLLVVEEQECLSLWVDGDICVLHPGEEITFPAIPSC